MSAPLTVEVVSGRPRICRDGRPIALRTATEHYGALLNRAFDYADYLPMLARSGSNLTRTFVLFRELQSAVNPYSTCKPESIDYLAPYARVEPDRTAPSALDGQPRFDLDRWDPEFFDRLHDFLDRADEVGVVVELTLFSNAYADAIWELHPLHHANNVNDLTPAHWSEHITARHPDRWARQSALITKIVRECRDHPNVIFEPCNEPGAGSTEASAAGPVSQAEVNAWLAQVIEVIRSEDGGRHLIAGQEAFRYEPWDQPLDLSLAELDFDIVNVHPLPGTTLAGQTYELGRFMSGDLELANARDFCAAAAAAAKPVNLDEDNTASQYTNDYGWRIHRRRAWVALLSGCHYDLIDFTIRPGLPVGSPAAQADLRVWTRFLGEAAEQWSLAEAELTTVPVAEDDVVAVGARLPDERRWLIYVADAREWAYRQPSDGPVTGTLTLPPGIVPMSAYDPRSGGSVDLPTPAVDGSITLSIDEDLLLIAAHRD